MRTYTSKLQTQVDEFQYSYGIIGRARLDLKGAEIDVFLLYFSYLRRTDVIQALHAEDSPNGWVGYRR